MLKKLRLQMTFFCTLVTGSILIAMSVITIISSETSLKKKEYLSFINDINSMIANLEDQSVLSYEWLVRMERNNQYIISISNNGNPILYDQLKDIETRNSLITAAKEFAAKDYGFTTDYSGNTSVLTKHIEFTLKEDQKEQYYVSRAVIPKNYGYLDTVILYSLEPLQTKLFQQRILFLFVNLFGIILLFIFSFFFTEKMLEPLKRSKELQTQFVTSASHELRTPLAVILSSLSALKKADTVQEAERFKSAIESEGQRMSLLIDDLLTLASAETSSFHMQAEEYEPDTLLLDTFEKFELLTAKKDIYLSILLPEETVPVCIGDQVRLSQVFSILLDNAISYTPEGGKIQLSLSVLRSHIEIRIADNGTGIPADQKNYVWEWFYRAEKSHTGKKHFGLGLAIANEIIKQHKGKAKIEDTPGGGATFIVILPIE